MLKLNHQKNFIWLLFLALIPLQFYLFSYSISKNITNFYPINFDQASFLPLSYITFEKIKQFGFFSGISHTHILETGMLFPIQAAIFYLVFGASRFTALVPNFFYFILLQFFSLMAIRSISPKIYISLFTLSLILLVQTPYHDAGSLTDFRMDFLAFCIYGIFLACAIHSKIFLSKKWTLLATSFAVLLILLRCISIVYFVGLMGCVIGFLFIPKSSNKNNPETSIRLKNSILVTLFLTTLAILYIWVFKTALFNYYIIGHVLGNEKNIRAIEVGVTNFITLISYYPLSLLIDHFGKIALLISSIFLILLIIKPSDFAKSMGEFSISFKPSITNPDSNKTPWTLYFGFLFLALIIPLVILTIDTNKSPVVGSIMVMPLTFSIIIFSCYLDVHFEKMKIIKMLFTTLASLFLFIGLLNEYHGMHHHKNKTEFRDLSAITKMYIDIGNYAETEKWPEVNLSVDQICDYLTASGITTIYYETTGKLLTVGINPLGAAIFPIDKPTALSSLEKSNVVILNLNDYPSNSPYPFNQSVSLLKPFIRNYTESHFVRLGDYYFFNASYRVYVQKTLAVRN